MPETSFRRKAAILLFSLLHGLFAYLCVLASFFLEPLIIRFHPAAGRNDTLSGQLLERPIWLPAIIFGFLIGSAVYYIFHGRSATWAWVLPALVLAWSILSWPSEADSVWNTFFGTDCGSSECLYQMTVTAPFYASVAYSLGASTALAFLKSKRRSV